MFKGTIEFYLKALVHQTTEGCNLTRVNPTVHFVQVLAVNIKVSVKDKNLCLFLQETHSADVDAKF